MPYEQKFIMCDTYAHTIDVSKSSAEGARKDLICARFRVIYGICESPDKRKVSCFRKKVDFILLIFFTRFQSAFV